METRKLYYENSLLRSFTATVTGCRETPKGFAITLDATAFYPEGGGQAADTGTLEGIPVLDVREADGQIVHLCAAPLTPGTTVTGILDWQGRFDRMQQHTGEHIVSGIVHRLFGYHNVGFHMGSDVITIDFDGPVPADALAEIEREANEKVWENVPVRCWYPSPEELPTVGYRSKKEIPWPVRIVSIPGADDCACCGTHVPYTGQIGLVKLFSCVKFHQGVRIEMACGRRALELLSKGWEQNRQVSQAFSAKVLETGEAARKMKEQLAQEKYHAASLQKQLFTRMAGECAGRGDVLCMLDGLAPAQLRELAEAIGTVCGGVAAVLTPAEEGFSVCLARPGSDVKALGREMADSLCGRGGGKPGFFQGSLLATEKEIRAFFAAFWCFEG